MKKATGVSTELLMLMLALALSGVVIFALLQSSGRALDFNALSKDYLARDLSLIIDAVYASPGEVTYVYVPGPSQTHSVRMFEGLVEVSGKSFEDDKVFSYRFASDKNIDFQFTPYNGDIPDYDNLINNPLKFTIAKKIQGGRPIVSVIYS